MIDLGHNLGLNVVAEGVEHADDLQLLRRLGCDLAQGFHLARPLPLELGDIHIHRNLADRLNRIGMNQCPHRMRHLNDLAHRSNHARFIIRPHDRNQADIPAG